MSRVTQSRVDKPAIGKVLILILGRSLIVRISPAVLPRVSIDREFQLHFHTTVHRTSEFYIRISEFNLCKVRTLVDDDDS